jgi:tetratricopeptide (TPR) repeat protein
VTLAAEYRYEDSTMFRYVFVWFVLSTTVFAADPAELFREAENLARSKRKAEALEKAERAITEVARLHAAGEDAGWHGYSGFCFAAKLAREDFLDYQKSLGIANQLLEMAATDYWRIPARLERAATFRAMGDLEKAQQEYDTIGAADERYRPRAAIPRATMVLFEIGDEKRGRQLMVEAVMNVQVNSRERFNAIKMCAAAAMTKSHRDDALDWYALTEKLPFSQEEERGRSLSAAWYEMGRIHESLGDTARAKALYRKTMDLETGEMRYRVRARDALESIEYFE